MRPEKTKQENLVDKPLPVTAFYVANQQGLPSAQVSGVEAQDMPPQDMPIVLTECLRSKSANARIRDGQIHLKIPKRWPKAYKQQVAESLVERILRRHAKENKQLDMLNASDVERITLSSQKELEAYVHQLNAETFRVPLGPIRIGTAKYTRLAQVNLKTRVMTVSAYCLTHVPAPALRYLIVHELAHFLEGSHNKRFWNLVAQFVPDYKTQSKLMTAFHQRAVQQDEAHSMNPSGETHPLLLKEKKSRGLKSQESSQKSSQKAQPQKEPGIIQSLLWDWLKF